MDLLLSTAEDVYLALKRVFVSGIVRHFFYTMGRGSYIANISRWAVNKTRTGFYRPLAAR